MRQKKEKSVINFWAGSILAALVAAAAVFGVMVQTEKKLLEPYEKGEIYVAVQEIPKGELITADNAGTYLKWMELDTGCIPPTALTQIEQIQDLVAAERIEEGVLLTQGMFETMDEITAGMEQPVIAGFKAEDLYQVAGGVLRSGDRIHVYQADEEGTVRLRWSGLFVQQVFDASGRTIGSEDTATSAQRINIYLDKKDVEQFYSDLSTHSLRVVKVCE